MPVMSDEKIIQFPGGGAGAKKSPKSADAAGSGPAAGSGKPDRAIEATTLSADQQKAIGIIASGMPFVLIGIKSTGSGADFFTAIAGEPSDLRNARDHLDGVITRAFDRKGL